MVWEATPASWAPLPARSRPPSSPSSSSSSFSSSSFCTARAVEDAAVGLASEQRGQYHAGYIGGACG
eukprot:1470352-Rhodomonas_salina.1